MLLLPLEKALNFYIGLDPEAKELLTHLDHKLIALEITDWNLNFYLKVVQQHIQLLEKTALKPDTLIKGTLFDLFKVGLAQGDQAIMRKTKVEIAGDLHTGQMVQKLLYTMNVDWEDHLSKVVGDSLAYRLYQPVRVLKRW